MNGCAPVMVIVKHWMLRLLVEVLPDGQVGSLAALAQLHVAGGLGSKGDPKHLEIDLEIDLEISANIS